MGIVERNEFRLGAEGLGGVDLVIPHERRAAARHRCRGHLSQQPYRQPFGAMPSNVADTPPRPALVSMLRDKHLIA